MSIFIFPVIYSSFLVDVDGSEDYGLSFVSRSDNNPELSFVPAYNETTIWTEDNSTAGSAPELNNTLGNFTQYDKMSFDSSKPIEEYQTNSSDWNIISDTDPNLTGTSVNNMTFK